MQFRDIIGHEETIVALRDMIDSGRIPHALLLSGPAGIGKMRLARAFVQYLVCEHREGGDSCGHCPACRRAASFSNPDIHYIYPVFKRTSPRRDISEDYLEPWIQMLERFSYMPVEQWMSLLDAGNSQPMIYVSESDRISYTASLSTFSDKYKVFLIWLPEKMQPAAANKLLKLIEEPHDDTLFICVSNEPGAILPTIYSRLRRLDMRRPSEAQISEALKRGGLSEEAAARTARLCEGNLQKAIELASNAGEREAFGIAFRDMMRAAYSRNCASLRSMAEDFSALGREKSLRQLDFFATMVRENFIFNLKIGALNVMTPKEEEFSMRFAPFVNVANVEKLAAEIDEARRDIARNANSKLVWFDLMLRFMMLLRLKPTETQNK